MYIVEENRAGNPRILKKEGETFVVLTFGAGEKTIADLVELCRLANSAESAGL